MRELPPVPYFEKRTPPLPRLAIRRRPRLATQAEAYATEKTPPVTANPKRPEYGAETLVRRCGRGCGRRRAGPGGGSSGRRRGEVSRIGPWIHCLLDRRVICDRREMGRGFFFPPFFLGGGGGFCDHHPPGL